MSHEATGTLLEKGASAPGAVARITSDTPGGRFVAYASVIDNRTNDPVYIPGP